LERISHCFSSTTAENWSSFLIDHRRELAIVVGNSGEMAFVFLIDYGKVLALFIIDYRRGLAIVIVGYIREVVIVFLIDYRTVLALLFFDFRRESNQ
jgi:hypothetical protein